MSTPLSSDSLTTKASFVPTPTRVAPTPVSVPVAPKVDDSAARNERRRKRNLGF